MVSWTMVNSLEVDGGFFQLPSDSVSFSMSLVEYFIEIGCDWIPIDVEVLH